MVVLSRSLLVGKTIPISSGLLMSKSPKNKHGASDILERICHGFGANHLQKGLQSEAETLAPVGERGLGRGQWDGPWEGPGLTRVRAGVNRTDRGGEGCQR